MSISDQAPERASYPIGFRPQRETSGAQQSGRPDMTLQRAPWLTRIVYVLALAASVLPFGASGWVSLAVGAGSWAGLSLIVVLALAVYRGLMVLTHPGASRRRLRRAWAVGADGWACGCPVSDC
jgi:hypothetical protein